MFERIKAIAIFVILLPVYFYQRFISPFLPKSCIYDYENSDSCSVYFVKSVKRFGILRGFILGLARLFRCNGFLFTGGVDRVPDSFSFKKIIDDYSQFFRYKK